MKELIAALSLSRSFHLREYFRSNIPICRYWCIGRSICTVSFSCWILFYSRSQLKNDKTLRTESYLRKTFLSDQTWEFKTMEVRARDFLVQSRMTPCKKTPFPSLNSTEPVLHQLTLVEVYYHLCQFFRKLEAY